MADETNTTSVPSTPATAPSTPSSASTPKKGASIFSGSPKPSYLPDNVGNEVFRAPKTETAEVTEGKTETQEAVEQPVTTQQQPPVQPVQPVQQQPIVPLTPEALQTLLKEVRGQQPQQQQQAAPISDEEFNRTFNIFNADEATYEAILGVKPDDPQRIAALNSALQGVARQAVTISRYLLQQEVAKLQQTINPVISASREAWEAQKEQTFYQKYSDLREYRPLLKEIVISAQARGVKFASEDEAMDYVAKTAYELLRRAPGQSTPPTQQGSGQQNGGTQPGTPANRMTTLSGGGRSGSGGTATPQLTTGKRLFGSVPNNFVRK